MRKTNTPPASSKRVRNWLQLAQLRYEKCELAEARAAFDLAFQAAKRLGDLRLQMEAMSGLLRLAADSLDEESIRYWGDELDALMLAHEKKIPMMAWYCKGVIARRSGRLLEAQRYVHRYVRLVRATPATENESEAKGWVLLASILRQRGQVQRARWLAENIIERYGNQVRGIKGLAAIVLGALAEGRRDLDESLRWYQLAHASFLSEHNWYYHLYVLYGYARIFRQQQNYTQAYWHLDLVDKATSSAEFALLRKEVSEERARLEQNAVDLLIDSRQALIKTDQGTEISLGKQYVLLNILEELTSAHSREGDDAERGLSKAEIIEKVWQERYRPEAHDNKLYYNINRLRKLIEPDVRKPRYLLNWKEGYRLAPGLRVQFIGGRTFARVGEQSSPSTKEPGEKAVDV